ncbi:peptide transporter 5 [Rhynchospora pubera]|uniref:Peptide transporter 5 n=1 Tax=Rhynchospora pubera TaxID=906938 RepID=A0AAV8DXC2_9POAL|nr:peptide transporter 5 [Rhynchospora pubera]
MEEALLVEESVHDEDRGKDYTGDGSVDLKGRPILKHKTGNWKACFFILGTESRNVTTWQGTCYLTPLIGAILADSYWGKYWTIASFATIYFVVGGSRIYFFLISI